VTVRPFLLWLVAPSLWAATAAGQMSPPDSEPVRRWSLSEYLAQVTASNLDYAAQTFSVPIAEAQLAVARLIPNPTLAWSATKDVSGQHQATSYDLSLTQTILLGGKRSARSDVARAQLGAARAQLDDFLRTLLGTAATAYADATHAEQVYARKRRTVGDLERLVVMNERRVLAGDIGEIDLLQSRVDARQANADLAQAASDVRTSRLALTGLLSPRAVDTLVAVMLPPDLALFPPGDDTTLTPAPLPAAGAAGTPALRPIPGGLTEDSLVALAVALRPDVVAARRARDAARAGVLVAGGDRWPDIDLTVGGGYFTRGTNPLDPTPIFSSLTVGLSLPLPFSDLTHGEINAARGTSAQAERMEASAEWRAAIEVRQAWRGVEAASVTVSQYGSDMLLDAERVRRAKLYSYAHGAASLLDVLQAEQTVNAVYLASYDAEQQYQHALIQLAQASGVWFLVGTTARGSR